MMSDHLCRMAHYNRWANQKLYGACGRLSDEAYHAERKMFFGSIHGTLNHLLIGDQLWLARIEGRSQPAVTLYDRPYDELPTLKAARDQEDQHMIDLTESYADADLSAIINYRMVTKPDDVSTPLHLCWLHLFNHQTHHRGQIHDQLSQTDVAPPPLDLIFYLRESE